MRRELTVEELRAIEPQLVIIRKRDGSFNFADLISEEPKKKRREFSAEIAIERGRLLYIDQKLGTRLEMKDLDSDASWDRGKLALDTRFVLNGGKSRLVFRTDLSQRAPPFEIERLRIKGATLASSLAPLGFIVPVLGNKPKQVSGIESSSCARSVALALPSQRSPSRCPEAAVWCCGMRTSRAVLLSPWCVLSSGSLEAQHFPRPSPVVTRGLL